MWGRRKEEQEHIQITPLPRNARGIYLFEKTQTYTLTGHQLITVPSGYTATVHFKFNDPITVTPCSRKSLIKAGRIRSDKLGKQFYIIFKKATRLPQQSWAVGNHCVKRNGFPFMVGVNGHMDLSVTDVDKYIATIGEGACDIFTNDSVIENSTRLLSKKADEVLEELLEEVDAFITDGSFLTEEYMIRLRDAIHRDDPFSQFGIEFPALQVHSVRVRIDDIQKARDYFTELAKTEQRRNSAPSDTDSEKRSSAASSSSAAVAKSTEISDNAVRRPPEKAAATADGETVKVAQDGVVKKKRIAPTGSATEKNTAVKTVKKTRPVGTASEGETKDTVKKVVRKKPPTPEDMTPTPSGGELHKKKAVQTPEATVRTTDQAQRPTTQTETDGSNTPPRPPQP